MRSLLDLFSHSSTPSQTQLALIVSSTSFQMHHQVSSLFTSLLFCDYHEHVPPNLFKKAVCQQTLSQVSLPKTQILLELSPRLITPCISITAMFSLSLDKCNLSSLLSIPNVAVKFIFQGHHLSVSLLPVPPSIG